MANHQESIPIGGCRVPHNEFRRVGATLASVAAVIASLLAFPSAMPWIGGWILGHTLRVARHRPGGVPLIAGLAILLVKRPHWPPSLCALVLVIVATAVLGTLPAHIILPVRNLWRGAGTLLLWGGLALVCLPVAFGYDLQPPPGTRQEPARRLHRR